MATLDQALADPAILERMNLPGQSPYGTSRASLLASPTKIGILIDSSQGYFSPKMRLLQRELAGKNRTILYRDPAEQRDHFAQVLGDRLRRGQALGDSPGGRDSALHRCPVRRSRPCSRCSSSVPSSRWSTPGSSSFAASWPRPSRNTSRSGSAENVPLVNDKKKAIPKEIQEGLDVYATYYLALAHLERNRPGPGRDMFQKLLELLPEPGPNQPYYNMFRWGANANLGRIYEAKRRLPPGHRPLQPARSDHAVSRQPAAGPRAGLAGPDGRRPPILFPPPQATFRAVSRHDNRRQSPACTGGSRRVRQDSPAGTGSRNSPNSRHAQGFGLWTKAVLVLIRSTASSCRTRSGSTMPAAMRAGCRLGRSRSRPAARDCCGAELTAQRLHHAG